MPNVVDKLTAKTSFESFAVVALGRFQRPNRDRAPSSVSGGHARRCARGSTRSTPRDPTPSHTPNSTRTPLSTCLGPRKVLRNTRYLKNPLLHEENSDRKEYINCDYV